MAPHDTREIVIEFEKVQMIRKRARTVYTYCRGCGGEADFVALAAAARLFDKAERDLRRFIDTNAVHYDGDIDICIPSLLAVMHAKQNGGGPKLIGSGRDTVPDAAA